ncbi:Lrp/AsnC family transcriptional regulator [Exilibacterium tricleocarpae]|uniref:Lrp/AsnC family transcriptional regulator n=1 Tax=Exilibacterium tricleocarpae TaxID=2591008 RepID=A0A545TM37_9GAMM|nr:Lrp/AsnC family transcriptional regulator [Exilibacterium tricleocarpae]
MRQSIDHLDLRILQHLQTNAKTTNQDLADTVGLSPSSCLQRVRRLEDKGYIDRYLARVNLSKLCRSITCITTVTLKQHAKEDFDQFEQAVAAIPEVVECFTVSGGFDFVLKVVCPDMDRYLALNNELVAGGANIENVSTHVVMNENKPFTGYPLDTLIDKPD